MISCFWWRVAYLLADIHTHTRNPLALRWADRAAERATR